MFEFLEEIGAASVSALWVPALVWTGLAGAVALSLTRARGLHPMMGYRLRQALLLALSASLLAAPWIPAPWASSRAFPEPGLPSTLEPTRLPPTTGGVPLGPEAGTGVDVALALLGAAAAGVLLLAVVRIATLGADLHRLRRLRRAVPTVGDPAAHRLLRGLSERFGVRRPVQLLEGPPGSVPMTFGARRPVVVVPRPLLGSPDSLGPVLAHELIHVRRADYAWALLDGLTAALFAFHPLVRLLRRGIERCRETSCDAEVVAADIVRPKEYAELLVRTQSPGRFPETAVAASMSAPFITLKQRLETMEHFADRRLTPRQRLGTLFASGILFVVIATLGASASRTGPDSPARGELPVLLPSLSKDLSPGVEGAGAPKAGRLDVTDAHPGFRFPLHSDERLDEEIEVLEVQIGYLRERMRQRLEERSTERYESDPDDWYELRYLEPAEIDLFKFIFTALLERSESLRMEREIRNRLGD